jgi:hypothetical protein
MARKKVSRNAPCPCGSGKKYKKCCWGKGFDYEEDGDGTILKSIPMSEEVVALLDEQRQRFPDEHGREPSPDDPVFFDLPHPERVEHLTVQAMKAAGIDPAFIYAFEKTGRLVTEQNRHLLSDGALDEWQAAVEEYEATRGRQEPPQYPIGTVALYGPDDQTTTKIAAGVILRDGAVPILKRWVATDVTTNPTVRQEMKDFFLKYGVKSVALSEGNTGCPHEEGEDFPHGEDCPFCPFWEGKQGSSRRD